MDIKQIVDKAIAGGEYKKDIEALPIEQRLDAQEQVFKALSEQSDKELSKVSALRKEQGRIEKKPEDTEKKNEDNEFVEAVKQRSKSGGKNKFFNDPRIKLTDAEKADFEKKIDEDKSIFVDADDVYKKLISMYASSNPEKFLENQDIVNKVKSGAYDFTSMQAGSDGASGGGKDDEKYTQQAKDIVKEAKKQGRTISLDAAQKLADRGSSWQNRNLSK